MSNKRRSSNVNIFNFPIREFKWTEKQKELIRILEDKKTNVVFVKGVSGTSKSLISVFAALKMFTEEKIDKIVYIRNPVESSRTKIGHIPGDVDEKMAPYGGPLIDKLDELISPGISEELIESGVISTIPLGFLRGRDWKESFVIFDECQNATVKDFLTTATRLGKNSKMVFLGDTQQSDIIGGKFSEVFAGFDNEEAKKRGVITFQFEREDIMRNPILGFLIDTFEKLA